MSDADDDETESDVAVVLDYLPHGRAEDDRPQYQKSPLAYAVSESDFRLLELELEPGTDVGIDDRVAVDPPEGGIESVRDVGYDALSSGARSELEYVVEDVVEADERRFVDFFNEAGPITLRLHQLNLLPGIGEKLRDGIVEERNRRPFESFGDLSERVDGLHDPKGVLVDRITDELSDEDLKYRIFVRDGASSEE